jgi:ATP-dependent Clp protease ATP-binding subunit ClpC
MPNKMERFTQRAQRVLALAQEAAERFQHEIIGPEHLLIGLMREEGGVAGRVLRDLGLDARGVEEVVEKMTPPGQRAPDSKLDVSVQTKKDRKAPRARRMGNRYIGTGTRFGLTA